MITKIDTYTCKIKHQSNIYIYIYANSAQIWNRQKNYF